MRSTLALCPLLALVACGKEEAATPYDHQAGTYSIEFVTQGDLGDCDFDTIYLRYDPVSTTVEADAAAGEMAVAFDDGDQTLLCDLEINAFSCEPVALYDTDLAGDGLEAVVTTSFTLDGEWTGDAAFGGTYTFGFTCEGADCGDLSGTAYGASAAFPCTLGGTVAGALE